MNLICDHRDVAQCSEKAGAVEMNGKKVQDAAQLGKEPASETKAKSQKEKKKRAKTA